VAAAVQRNARKLASVPDTSVFDERRQKTAAIQNSKYT